jgi:dihydroorotate dehydrogenase
MVVLTLLLIILSTLGVADTAFLSYEKLVGVVPACHIGFSCTSVLNSQWSMIGPVPLSFIGLVYYLSVWSLAVALYMETSHLRFSKWITVHTLDLLIFLTTGGLLISLYLVVIMGLVLKAWCFYCLISAATSTSLFLVARGLGLTQKEACPLGCVRGKRVLLKMGYQWLLKPLLFLFPAELVHTQMTRLGALLGRFEWGRRVTRWLFNYQHPSLVRKVDGILFRNPVGLAAGFDYEAQLSSILPEVGFGFMTVGTVTLRPYLGNPSPRLGRFPKSQSLLVNKGFKSQGAKVIIQKLTGQKFRIPVGISIGSTNAQYSSLKSQIQDIIKCFTLFEKSMVKHLYYELNISCPNTQGGQPFTTPERLEFLLTSLDKRAISRPVYIKMPIDLSPQETLALLKVADRHHIRGVVFGNLTKDKANPDVAESDRKVWIKSAGNVSGKPTWNRSNTMIALTKKHFKSRFTIIGTGGIFSALDAQTKLALGADLVQLITGMIYQGPQLIGEINQHLAKNN